MIELSYTLKKEDLLKYYQMILNSSDKTKSSKIIALIWGPALLAALVLLTKLLHVFNQMYVYIALILAAIWVIFIYPICYDRITSKVVQKKYKFESDKLQKVDILENKGDFKINGVEKELDNYYGYKDLIILNFKDNSNLIVPQRVFEKEDVLREFIKDIMLKAKK